MILKNDGGKVELRNDNGGYVGTIVSNNATRARWQGNDIAITLGNGKIEIRNKNGGYIRTI